MKNCVMTWIYFGCSIVGFDTLFGNSDLGIICTVLRFQTQQYTTECFKYKNDMNFDLGYSHLECELVLEFIFVLNSTNGE